MGNLASMRSGEHLAGPLPQPSESINKSRNREPGSNIEEGSYHASINPTPVCAGGKGNETYRKWQKEKESIRIITIRQPGFRIHKLI